MLQNEIVFLSSSCDHQVISFGLASLVGDVDETLGLFVPSALFGISLRTFNICQAQILKVFCIVLYCFSLVAIPLRLCSQISNFVRREYELVAPHQEQAGEQQQPDTTIEI